MIPLLIVLASLVTLVSVDSAEPADHPAENRD